MTDHSHFYCMLLSNNDLLKNAIKESTFILFLLFQYITIGVICNIISQRRCLYSQSGLQLITWFSFLLAFYSLTCDMRAFMKLIRSILSLVFFVIDQQLCQTPEGELTIAQIMKHMCTFFLAYAASLFNSFFVCVLVGNRDGDQLCLHAHKSQSKFLGRLRD